MQDKICLITGATSGIGEVTARELAKKGTHVVLLARNLSKAENTRRAIIRVCGHQKVDILLADLSSLKQVRSASETFGAKYPRLDVLVNNAGFIAGPKRQLSEDGFELTLATNHLGPFLLTSLLMGKLLQSRQARIINVSSGAHQMARPDLNDLQMEKNYSPMAAYSNSKLYNILFTQELARRYKNKNISSNALHPGIVASNFTQTSGGGIQLLFKLLRPFMLSAEKGARTTIYLASAEEAAKFTGGYFGKKKHATVHHPFATPENARLLWEISEQLTGANFPA